MELFYYIKYGTENFNFMEKYKENSLIRKVILNIKYVYKIYIK